MDKNNVIPDAERMKEGRALLKKMAETLQESLPEPFEINVVLMALCELYHGTILRACASSAKHSKEIFDSFEKCNLYTKEHIEDIIKNQEKDQ